MKYSSLNDFVMATPNAKWCARNVAEVLKEKGFIELEECSPEWKRTDRFTSEDLKGIYVIRGGTIIAVKLPMSLNGFSGVLTHSDSPCFKIKTNPEIHSNGYVKLNVEPYGGGIYYSWLDKPLSICGQVIDDYRGIVHNIDIGSKYQVFIPSQAIHINREVNSSLNLNPQKDMLPVFSLDDEVDFIESIIKASYIDAPIRAHDLSLYNPEPVKTLEMGNYKIAMGPRLDNLASVFSALRVFEDDADKVETAMDRHFAHVFVAFDSEEIGSATYEGADGSFLTSVLERICNMYGVEKYPVFANSHFLSIDAAHAIHPNAPEKSDPTNPVKFGEGVVLKHNSNYANTLEMESRIKNICRCSHIKAQDFYSRSDMRCGATLGNISMSHHGIQTLDIGIPMLAMHSAVETICLDDMNHLENLLFKYYKTW